MLGVVASVLAVVCKRMQQLPTMLGPAVHHGKDTIQKTLETMCNARAWPQQWRPGPRVSLAPKTPFPFQTPATQANVGRAVQTDPTLFCSASLITERKRCWELLVRKFDRFQIKLHATTPNAMQQHLTGCTNQRNM